MSAVKKIIINNFVQIRTLGLKALKDALGVVGATRFIQQYDTGSGDYTKENIPLKKKMPKISIPSLRIIDLYF